MTSSPPEPLVSLPSAPMFEAGAVEKGAAILFRAVAAVLFAALFSSQVLPAKEGEAGGERCGSCHSEEATRFNEGVHRGSGLTCTACHGGDPKGLEGACVGNRTFKGIQKGVEAVELCGGCHSDVEKMHQYGLTTDQYRLYRSSEHGRALFGKGNKDVATCVNCHGAHGIRRVKDPLSPVYKLNVPGTCTECHGDKKLMARYGLPSDTFVRYRRGVHGKRLVGDMEFSSPACPDCHGSHAATPPRVKEIANVCRTCHRITADYFSKGPHAGLEEQCVACHNHHETEVLRGKPLAGRGKGLCGSCHETGEKGLETAVAMDGIIGELKEGIAGTQQRIREARASGLFASDEEGYLEEAELILTEVEPMTHAADRAVVENAVQRGTAVLDNINDSLDLENRALRDRKIGSAAAAAVMILLGLVLYARARAMEVRRPVLPETERPATPVEPRGEDEDA